MTCSHTGASVAPEHNPRHQYSGDEYECTSCGNKVVTFSIGVSGNRSDREPKYLIRENRSEELQPKLKLVKGEVDWEAMANDLAENMNKDQFNNIMENYRK
jgi:hypothetical protein